MRAFEFYGSVSPSLIQRSAPPAVSQLRCLSLVTLESFAMAIPAALILTWHPFSIKKDPNSSYCSGTGPQPGGKWAINPPKFPITLWKRQKLFQLLGKTSCNQFSPHSKISTSYGHVRVRSFFPIFLKLALTITAASRGHQTTVRKVSSSGSRTSL